MPKKPELFLEEAVLDDFSKSFDTLEAPLSKKAFNLVIFFTLLITVIVSARIAFLVLKNGDFYKNRALANISEITVIPAERGIIFDRYNKPLVKNLTSFKVVLKLSDFFKKDKNSQIDELKSMEEILNLPRGQIEEWIKEIDLGKQNFLILSINLTIEQVAKIKTLNLADAQIQNDFYRQYEEPGIFSHILGYVGVVSVRDLKDNSDLLLNDLIGKSGLEFFYDNSLRGKNGEIINYRNAKNESINQKASIGQARGNNIYLTIDKDFQSYFYYRLKEQLDNLGRVGGVGIAINPQNGEILALISLPSFDNNKISPDVISNYSRPLFNRAISGLYNPGSTIKPLVAIAALKENVISPFKEIFSPGYLEIPNPYHPDQPSRFLDWKPNGWVNLYSAIARSCNIYFYEVGGGYGEIKGLGIERLRDYWKKFGLEEKTGIDLPGEKSGFLPGVEEKEKRTGTPWRLGDTYNNSIGQGDIMITPLELINYIASIAAKGKIFKPFIVRQITDDNGNVIKENFPQVIIDNFSLSDAIREVEKGMIDTTKKSYGTAFMLNDLPIVVAAKTGSAQIERNTKVNAFFVGYNTLINADNAAPKQIAVLILIENAREGSLNAVPVAKDVFKWYYDNRIRNSH